MDKHLQEVNETYFTHMVHSLRYSLKFLKAFLACIVHAFIPSLCVKTGSTIATEVCNDVNRRKDDGV